MSADNARKLFVGGLGEGSSDAALRSLFEEAGFTVVHLAVPRDRETGAVRGFAFVTLDSEQQARMAREQLSGATCEGRRLTVREFDQEPQKRGPRPKRSSEATVFLGKLPFDATQEEVVALFEQHGVGPVERVTLPTGPDGRPRGFGFATLPDDDAAKRAVEQIDGAAIRGRNIVVSPAQPRGAPPRGGAPARGASDPTRSGSPAAAPAPARYEERGPRAVRESAPPPESIDPFDFPMPPPDEGRRRRAEGKRADKKEKKKAGARGARKRRGGGGNWHQWEPEDD